MTRSPHFVNPPLDPWDFIRFLVECAHIGDRQADKALRHTAQIYIERGQSLPEPLRRYIIAGLDSVSLLPKIGRGGGTARYRIRNETICRLMHEYKEKTGDDSHAAAFRYAQNWINQNPALHTIDGMRTIDAIQAGTLYEEWRKFYEK